MARHRANLTGHRFGILTVIKDVGTNNGNVLWACQCDCGEIAIYRATQLMCGKKTDCGCIKKAQRMEQKEQRKAERKEKKMLMLKMMAEEKARRNAKTEEEKRLDAKLAECTKWSLNGTLCWSCIRSAAPPSLQCIWDKTKGMKMPEGCEFTTDDINHGIKTVITKCPEFLSLYERENVELLERERAKNKQEAAQDVYERVSVGVRPARG